MATGAALSLSVEAKRFGCVPLFEALRIDIAPSEVVALTGPSGIGKSTLLRMIAGLDCDFTGRITVDDTPAHRAPPPGFVFQGPRLLPWLDAVDNIRAVSPAVTRDEALALLDRVGLSQAASLLPHQMSGGMQRRVALARALSIRPRLLLLDEPFASLDAALAEDLRTLLQTVIAGSGATVLLVTHEPLDAATLANRVLVLDGRPAQVLADRSLTPQAAERKPEQARALAQDLARLQPSR